MIEPNRRVVAYLRAVRDGRAELTCSCEPDLRIDGVCVCDQVTAHAMACDGLVQSTTSRAVGQWVPATLTPAGRVVLAGA